MNDERGLFPCVFFFFSSQALPEALLLKYMALTDD